MRWRARVALAGAKLGPKTGNCRFLPQVSFPPFYDI